MAGERRTMKARPPIPEQTVEGLGMKELAEFNKSQNEVRLIHGEFQNVGLKDNCVPAIITDPPYGEEYLSLWRDLSEFVGRVLKPSGFLITYAGHFHLPKIINHLSKNLEYYWLAMLYQPGQNVHIRTRGLDIGYKPILIYQKSPVKKTNDNFVDVLTSERRSKEYHHWGQNVYPIIKLVEKFTEPKDVVVDPMAGGGTTMIACLATKRKCIAIDKNRDSIRTMIRRHMDHLGTKND